MSTKKGRHFKLSVITKRNWEKTQADIEQFTSIMACSICSTRKNSVLCSLKKLNKLKTKIYFQTRIKSHSSAILSEKSI